MSTRGYGVCQVVYPVKVNTVATKAAWFHTYGVWPTKKMLHDCDNTVCVRPDHLFEGTQADNMKDKVRKGRYGPKAISLETVAEIRKLSQDGMRNADIAKYLHLSREKVYRVTSGRSWACVK